MSMRWMASWRPVFACASSFAGERRQEFLAAGEVGDRSRRRPAGLPSASLRERLRRSKIRQTGERDRRGDGADEQERVLE